MTYYASNVTRPWPHEIDELSFKIGSNVNLTQGPGGNVSFKRGNELWIKASGTHLKNARAMPIFVGLDLDETRRNIEGGIELFPNRFGFSDANLRASIETSMHAQIEAPFVAHVHSVGSVSMSLLVDESLAINSASHYCKVSYVPYVRPGLGLATAFRDSVDTKSKAAILGNHGLTVWGDSTEECIEILNTLEGIWVDQFDSINVETSTSASNWKDVLTKGILVPDEVVFLGENPFRNLTPNVNVKDGLSDLAKLNLDRSVWLEEFVEVLELIAKNVNDPNKVKYLNQTNIDQLLNWEAEKYRQSRQY